jgi:hypothetical protein
LDLQKIDLVYAQSQFCLGLLNDLLTSELHRIESPFRPTFTQKLNNFMWFSASITQFCEHLYF